MSSPLLPPDTLSATEYFANKVAFTTGPLEVSKQLENGAQIPIIDVRDPADYFKGHVPGAVNLPQETWDTPAGLRRDMVNTIYCYSATCHLAAKAALQFSMLGYRVIEMEGGFEAWKENSLIIER